MNIQPQFTFNYFKYPKLFTGFLSHEALFIPNYTQKILFELRRITCGGCFGNHINYCGNSVPLLQCVTYHRTFHKWSEMKWSIKTSELQIIRETQYLVKFKFLLLIEVLGWNDYPRAFSVNFSEIYRLQICSAY